jgi:hypothetical protein
MNHCAAISVLSTYSCAIAVDFLPSPPAFELMSTLL